MKVHAIFNDSNDEIIEVVSHSLADCYTNQMIEDYLYVICDDHVKVFRWFVEGKNIFGTCIVKESV